MRAWLLTNTTYGSWLPGDSRGSVTSVRDRRQNDLPTIVRIEHDIPGEPSEDPIPGLEESARNLMKGPPLYLDHDKARIVLSQFQETAWYRGWVLRAVAIMYNHFHAVVLVPNDPHPRKILGDFKAYATRALNQQFGRPLSGTWWTDKGSKRRLKNDEAVADAVHYVTRRQPSPLLVWENPVEAGPGIVLGEP